nr:magnesium chelatase [Desulfobacterales bacterium]
MERPKTIRELKDSGYVIRSVKSEIRENLIKKIQRNEKLFPGIIGFEDTVIPQIENAILSGQDIILLGERGQAKTRLMRGFVSLLDQEIPVLAGCEIRDNPLSPVCRRCKETVAETGLETKIEWIGREKRYNEKLATPDVTMADLIGEIDPIKVAEGKYLSDERTIHFGLIPRSNRGIFALNELPDLAEKIQVGLFNILEERDVQIRGFTIRLPLDVYLMASANPEDYTNRGRIITPLKDRFGSQIRTHYPITREKEIQIMEQERCRFPEEDRIIMPEFMKEIVAEITRQARRHPEIDQASGVSVRVSISNHENVISNAIRRYLRLKETYIVPRITDLSYIIASTTGKVELEGFLEDRERMVVSQLIDKAVLEIFNKVFGDYDFSIFLNNLQDSTGIIVSDELPSEEYERQALHLKGLNRLFERLKVECRETLASALEFILEGLHQRGKLNKEETSGKVRYGGYENIP